LVLYILRKDFSKMELCELKKRICETIDKNAERITEIAQRVFAHPEMGYREFDTAELVCRELEGLGIPCKTGLARTGVKGILKGKESRATVAIIGELDSVICQSHPSSDPITGAAHACGHHAQLAAMLGAAIALSEIAGELDGDVCFFATPAEEYVELGFRQSLADKGEIKYFGGKQELIRLGEFDDIDMAMMVHAQGNEPSNKIYMNSAGLGFVAKTIDFYGKASHAAMPHDGINALNAAMAALMCIHAQRETFRDKDKGRVHPIITNGGELVNVVPEHVTMETFVRAASREAMIDASAKVDRAIEGAAFASLTTQIFTNIIMNIIVWPLRRNNILLVKGLNPKLLIEMIKRK
jgi:amidohydrolase